MYSPSLRSRAVRLPPTPCRVCFRPCVFNKFSHFWQKPKCKFEVLICAFCFLCTQRFGTFTFSPSRGQAGCSPRRHAARQTRPVHRPRPHRHTITNTTHVTQIRVHLKSSPPPQPTSRPPLARAARPRVPRRRRARRRKQQGRRKSTSGLSCPGPRSRSSAACAPAPCRPPSARPART